MQYGSYLAEINGDLQQNKGLSAGIAEGIFYLRLVPTPRENSFLLCRKRASVAAVLAKTITSGRLRINNAYYRLKKNRGLGWTIKKLGFRCPA